jgi:cytochrome c7-like protein
MVRYWKFALILLMVAGSVGAAGMLQGTGDPAPVQPIDFSHRVHAGENGIACLYCHSGAARTEMAGVPSVATCYECHRLVKLKSPEIAKVAEHWQSRQPMVWTRVYWLPDYVYFSHQRHVQAKLDCQECHGDVRSAARIAQESPLAMGWCLNCHEQRGAPRECNTCHK